MQRVFLIHGWGGDSGSDWFPWAKKTLTDLGYDVYVPEMPNTNYPKIGPWVNMLAKTVEKPKSDDVFIGHSIGCQTILRYLERLENGQKIYKVILIAPWWFLTLGKDEDPKVAEPWLNSIVNFDKVKRKVGEFICVFSEDDPWVPFRRNLEFYKKNLNPKIINKSGLGHFTADEGIIQIEFLPGLVK